MSRYGRKFFDLLVLSADSALLRSQMAALSKQLPLLYAILVTNALALAYTHYGTAPDFMTVIAPAAMVPICLQRVVVWSRIRVAALSDAQIRTRLRATIVMVCMLGVIFTAWSLALYPYGDAYARTHVAYFMSITVIGCIFCLMHLRPAALLLTAIVVLPFLARFMLTGNLVLTAIAFNFFLVSVIMIIILLTSYKSFETLVESQQHLKALSQENFNNANFDSLTGLANRRSFFNDIETMIGAYTPIDTGFTLGLIDLDGFKPVNDIYGHASGDLVLVEVGRRLRQILGPGVKLARLGGDEFGFALPGAADAKRLRDIGGKICKSIQRQVCLPIGTAQIEASIGFAAFPDMAQTREHLFERADYALYHAKENSRGTAVVFDEQHEKAIRARGRIEQELRQADIESELSLKFQPIVDLGTGRAVAFEALARWNSPVLGAVPPSDFIVAAEQMGIISRITQVLLRQALRAAAAWPDNIGLSFNLSVHDLASDAAVLHIVRIIQESGVRSDRIALEITETAVMRDFDQARDALLTLKATGAKIALDDFGTGFSSLSYVHRLPLDKIKVDRGFMAGLTTDRASQDIVMSILNLSRNLGLACIVEGVETAEQVLILRSLGCSNIQGYYYSRPLDVADLGAFLPQSGDVGEVAAPDDVPLRRAANF